MSVEKNVAAIAWSTALDSYHNAKVCVEYPPHEIALACIFIAQYLHGKIDVPKYNKRLYASVKSVMCTILLTCSDRGRDLQIVWAL